MRKRSETIIIGLFFPSVYLPIHITLATLSCFSWTSQQSLSIFCTSFRSTSCFSLPLIASHSLIPKMTILFLLYFLALSSTSFSLIFFSITSFTLIMSSLFIFTIFAFWWFSKLSSIFFHCSSSACFYPYLMLPISSLSWSLSTLFFIISSKLSTLSSNIWCLLCKFAIVFMKLTTILLQVRQYQCSLLSDFFFEPPLMYSYSAFIIPWHFIWYQKLHISHSIAGLSFFTNFYNDHKGFQHCPQSDFCLWYYILDFTSCLLVILNVAKVIDFTYFLI